MGEVLEHKKASYTIECNFAQMKLEKQVWCTTKSEGNSWANMYFFKRIEGKSLCILYTVEFSLKEM